MTESKTAEQKKKDEAANQGCGCLVIIAFIVACFWLRPSLSQIFEGNNRAEDFTASPIVITATPLESITITNQDKGNENNTNPWTVTIVGGLIVAVIGGIIVLYIEYTRFKPAYTSKTSFSSFATTDRPWATAMDKAIRNFKSQQGKYNWVYESLNVRDFHASKGKATFILAITSTRPSLGGSNGKPIILEQYVLTIIRTGDLIEVKSLPLEGRAALPN